MVSCFRPVKVIMASVEFRFFSITVGLILSFLLWLNAFVLAVNVFVTLIYDNICFVFILQ